MKKLSTRIFGATLALSTLPLAALTTTAAPASAASAAEVCASMTQPIKAAVNPSNGTSLLSPHQQEIQNAASKYGFSGGNGTAFQAGKQTTAGLVPVHRMFKDGDFMWLPEYQHSTEYNEAQSRYGYTSQQVDFYASPTPIDCAVPVFRYQKDGVHRMATTQAEQASLKAAGWTSEGAKFWVSAATDAAPQPVPNPADPPVAEPTTPPAPPTTPPVATPPPAVSADHVTWASIAKPGQDINAVLLNPALKGKILQLPAGVFEVANFKDQAKAVDVPANVKGIVGAGRDTIIRIKDNSSTFASSVPAQSTGATNQLYIMRMNNGKQPQILSDFWLQGTDQGHLYNGLMVGESKPGTTVSKLLITGVPGDAGFPPGETFGLNWWRGSDSITRDIEVDGHRVTGNTYAARVTGAVVGASPIGYNNHDGAKLYNAYTHDSNVGMPTFWQSNNAQTWNLQSIRNATGINHERSFNIVHNSPVIYGSVKRTHIQFMSDQGNGNLTIIGAKTDTWINPSVSGPIGVGNKMLILTPIDYAGTNGNSIKNAPKVFQADGRTPVDYLWAR